MSMTSFYGGQKGQDFELAEIFANRSELQADLNQRWLSAIPVGAYILISYGNDTTTYDENLKKDEEYQKNLGESGEVNYNSTFWRKIYIDKVEEIDTNGSYVFSTADRIGLAYEMLSQFTGATPRITVAYDKNTNAETLPSVAQSGTFKDPVFTFSLPRAWGFDSSFETLNANESPDFKLTENEEKTVKTITIKLPKSWDVQKRNFVALDADEAPTFDVSEDADNSVKYLDLGIPQAQVLQQGAINVGDSTTLPSFSLDSTDPNKPIISFIMPRAAWFYYVDKLNINAYTNTEAKVGDYVIDKETAYIYRVKSVDVNGLCTLEFKANLSGEDPDIKTIPISPYDTSTKQMVEPSVVASYTDSETERQGYTLTFNLPKALEVDATVKSAAPVDTPTVSKTYTNDKVTLGFSLPRGAQWYSGATLPSASLGAAGDFYLLTENVNNIDKGTIYKKESSEWVNTNASILGPISGVRLLPQETIQGTTDQETNDYMAAQLNNRGISPEQDQVVPVTFINTSLSNKKSSYYFYKINGSWTSQIISGDSAAIVVNVLSNSTTQSYSADYTNKLVDGAKADLSSNISKLNENLSADIKKNSDDISTLNGLVEENTGKIQQCESDIEDINTTIGNSSQEITNLKSKDIAIDGEINGIKSNITSINDNFKNYYTQRQSDEKFALISEVNTLKTTVGTKMNTTDANNTFATKSSVAELSGIVSTGLADRYTKDVVDGTFAKLADFTTLQNNYNTFKNSVDSAFVIGDTIVAQKVLGGDGSNLTNLNGANISASSLGTLKSNLKLPEDTVTALDSLTPKTGTEAWSSKISLKVGQMYLQHD